MQSRLTLPLMMMLTLAVFSTARAQNNPYGIAMQGKPLLSSTSEALGYADKTAPKGGSFKQGYSGSFDTLNPFSLKGKSAQGLSLVYDRLMARSWDEPFTLYPLIARQVEIPDDRSSITFTLDERARFHDGSAITADDVLFTFETLKTKGRANMRRIYSLVEKAEILENGKIRFKLGKVYDRETVMILAMMPVLSKTYWQDKDFEAPLTAPPISNGPYKIEKVDLGRRVTLKRVDDYWAKDLPVNRGLYNFDTVIHDYFRDDTVAFEAFKKGDLDVRVEIDPGKWATAYDFPALKSGKVIKENLKHGRVERAWGFIFNTRRAPLDDIKVREAFSLVLDYGFINKTQFNNAYIPTTSYFPNSDLAASGMPSKAELAILEPYKAALPPAVFGSAYTINAKADSKTLRANLLKADALLKQAGYSVANGIRVNSQTGKAVKLELLITMPEDEKIALSFKRALAKLGVGVSIRSLDNAAYLKRLNAYDYDMTLNFWQNTLSPGTEQYLYWSCEAAKQEARFNYAGLCLDVVDQITKQIPNAKNREELKTLTHALDRILTHSHLMVPLFYSNHDRVASWKKLNHPARMPLYGNALESWYIKKPQ